MFNDIKVSEISKGVTVSVVPVVNFKKKVVSVYAIVPADREKITAYLMIPKLVTLCCRKYPSIISMNNMLALNYGTRITGGSFLSGDNIVMSFNVSFVGDEYVPNNENVADNAINGLFDCIFDPLIVNGTFEKSNFENVRRMISESIASKIDEKQKYSITRLKEIMCEGEPFGVSDKYLLEKLGSITPEEVYTEYLELFRFARLEIISVGYQFQQNFYNRLSTLLLNRYNEIRVDTASKLKSARSIAISVTDKMQVEQGQLALGFRSLIDRNSDLFYAARIMCDIFGGGTYSLLFNNVREKQSLCYYCSAGLNTSKGVMIVSSGVDFSNFDKAKNAILEEFEKIKCGDFSDKLIEDSKLSFENELVAVTDTPDTIGSWQIRRFIENPDCSPEEYIAKIKAVTKEKIIEAANMFVLDTEFRLASED